MNPDLVAQLRRQAEIDTAALNDLRRWKAEATTVLEEWEAVWEAAGRPGQLGGSKAEAVHDWVRRRDGDAGPTTDVLREGG